MRILHVIDSIDPGQGGPSAVIVCLAAAQAALGHDVTIMGAREADRASVVDAFVEKIPGIENVTVIQLDRATARMDAIRATAFTDAFAELEREARPDVVQLHGVWDPPLVRTAHACIAAAVPYVISPHGMLDEWTLAQRSLKKKLALKFVHGRVLRNAATIHALNGHEKERISMMGFDVPISVIGNGVFLSDIDVVVPPGTFRSTVDGLGDRPFVLFLSRLHHKKGLDLLAEAWARIAGEFPEHRLVIAGRRDDDSMEECWQRIDRAGLRETVLEVGEVYGDRKVGAFRECTCFVLPSRQEGFSVAITEALGFGAPVVITDACHFPEVAEEQAGVVTSLEIADIARGLHRMLSDDDLRISSAANGGALVRERYTWPAIAARFIEMYEELIAG